MTQFKAFGPRRDGQRRSAGAGTVSAAVFGAALVMAATPGANAQTPDLNIGQYQHTRWTRADGVPDVHTIAQTPDGFLWLAGEGLTRFDGLSFDPILSPFGEGRGPITTLMVSRRGELWAWVMGERNLAVYRRGQLQFMPGAPGEGEVIALVEGPDGSIWACPGNAGMPLYRFRNGRWETVDATAGLPRSAFINMVMAADGALWASYANYTLRLAPGATRFQRIAGLDPTMGRVAIGPQGRVWLIDRGVARPVSGPGGQVLQTLPQERFPAATGGRPGAPVFDRDGDLWEATRLDGITRVGVGSGGRVLDRFGAEDGLSNAAAWDVFEDREGNLWVATKGGLDRFRRAPVVAEPLLARPATYGNRMTSASDGSVYIVDADSLYRARPGAALERVATGLGEPDEICEGSDGAIWIPGRSGITGVYPGGRRARLPRPPAAQGDLYDCAADPNGDLIVSAGGDGVFRWAGGAWQTERLVGGAPLRAQAISSDGRGALWANAGAAGLARWSPQGWRIVASRDNLPTRTIRALSPVPGGAIFSGQAGVGRIDDGGRASGPITAFPRPTGLLRTANGDVWAFGRRGLARFSGSEFDRALGDPDHKPAYRLFGFEDGLAGGGATQQWRALVQGGDGRIWLATDTSTAWIQPNDIPSNRLAPSVRITGMRSGDFQRRDPDVVHLAAGASELSIRFAALSLSIPERVQVRYRLEGVDHDWIDPGQRREAFYTNLAPGTYRFQVIAANEDGVWNRDGASLEFTIAPTFLQSIWFKFLIGLGLLGLAWGAYMLRMRQVTSALRERFQVRIAERERIARELHDTLLQGVQGLVLRFQSVASRLPKDGELRGSVEETLDRADALVVEGRARLRDLRRGAADIDLGRAIADAAGEIISAGKPAFQLTEEGEPRALEPTAADELLRIAEEAMRNAVLHGDANQIEALLVYGRRDVRLAIRDNGRGMPAEVLEAGQRSGHFGLVGMRERAERIGGRFAVSSRTEGGTEVSVSAPSSRVYRDDGRLSWSRLTRLWRRPPTE